MKFWHHLSLKQSMILSVLLLSGIVSIFQIGSIYQSYRAQKAVDRVARSHTPTVVASMELTQGLQTAFYSLQSWATFGEAESRAKFLAVWERGIYPAFEKLKALERNWMHSHEDEEIDLKNIESLLQQLEILQKEVLEIAQSDDNSPALKLFLSEIVPAGDNVAKSITALIDLEAENPPTPERKMLFKHMADVRGSLGLSMSAMRSYLLVGDQKYQEEFNTQWAKNDQAYSALQDKQELLTGQQASIYSQMELPRTLLDESIKEVITLRTRADWNLSYDKMKRQVIPLYDEIHNLLAKLEEHKQEALFQENIELSSLVDNQTLTGWLLFGVSIGTMVMLFALVGRLVFKRVGGEPKDIERIAHEVAIGDLSQEFSNSATTTGIRLALQHVVGNLRATVEQANQIADGNYTATIKPLSEKDDLGHALLKMLQSLRQTRRHMQDSDWLKTNRAELSDELRGEQNLVQLGNKAISKLANSTGAQVGAFYLLREQGSDSLLKMIASYAYFSRKDGSHEFKLGEGLVGQAALEGKPMVFSQLPADYISIKSGVGETTPGYVLLIPFFHEDSLQGVIELAKLEPFTELQLDFLKLIAPGLGTSIYTAEASSRMQVLLEQSQTQAEELQSQSEELQSQQEELRQANEELAEHMNELKQQRQDIQEKNSVLESTQAEVRESQRMLSNLMDNLPGMVYQIAPDASYSFVSQGSVELLGYEPEDLYIKHVIKADEFYYSEDRERVIEEITQALREKQPYSVNYRIVDRSGQEKWIFSQGRGFYSDTDELLYMEGLMTDVTERYKSQEALEKSNQYKSEFLANMSHELRTPLNSLLILSQLLMENKKENLNKQQIEQARTINSAGKDLLNLINDILDLSKVEAGKLQIHHDTFNLTSLIDEITQKFQPVAEDKTFTFNVSLSDKLPKSLSTDAQRLKQILNNLLSNAFKFTEQGHVSLSIERPENDETIPNPNTTLAFRVEDTGIGIPEDKLEHIFGAFQQVDGAVNRRYGGTGLGLSISRELAELLGGHLTASSTIGEGSVFTLYLPENSKNKIILSEPPATAPQSQTRKKASATIIESALEPTEVLVAEPMVETPAKLSTPVADYKIEDDRDTINTDDKLLLIIEDDLDFAQTLRSIANEKNFKCLLAGDGEQGIKLANERNPDAIMLDIGLPKINGWSVMETLKSATETRHIPIHCISAMEEELTARRMGANSYLLKPINMHQLVEELEKIQRFIGGNKKNLLIASDSIERQTEIKNLLAHKDLSINITHTWLQTLTNIQAGECDCIVLDIDIENGQGIARLESNKNEEMFANIPLILYSDRRLTETEILALHQIEDNLIIKSVHSPERLLEEATLFLHQIEASLPEEKQRMLRMMHDKEALLAGKKILVVDDDMRNFFALAAMLEDRDMEVISANNGQDALAKLEEYSNIDVVLMDIMMPVMDGYETMRNIRAQPRFKNLPIIALTAKAMKDDKNKCIEAGANDYLSKPIDINKLISLIRVWLYR